MNTEVQEACPKVFKLKGIEYVIFAASVQKDAQCEPGSGIRVRSEYFILVLQFFSGCTPFVLSFWLTAQDRYEPILARIRAGDAASAESEINRIINDSPGDSWARFYLGTLYATRRDYLPTISKYREAARLEPKIARFHLALGCACRDIAHYDEAIQALRTAIEREPGNAEACFVLGAIYHLKREGRICKEGDRKRLADRTAQQPA